MRYVLFTITLATCMHGQAIMDASAAAAGGVAGGTAGKKVNDGMNSVLGKIGKQTSQTAGEKPTAEKAKPIVAVQSTPASVTAPSSAPSSGSAQGAPLLDIGPGVPQSSGGVPLPPAAPHKVVAARPAPPPAPAPEPVRVAPPSPPPPQVTADDLKNVTAGMNRDTLLKMGAPGSRITMFEDGHLQESYRYYAHGPNGDTSIGVVRLVDGSVSSVRTN